uniref:Chitin-binding type-2 domain-containing protein n=1 Tax=Anopheles christyi TaxID=43041 RepID=A0A182KC07_9DIPT
MDSYQGLVGRPGIDFPVLTHIPKTVFDCKNHGNGYFADLETRCQVFHICDDGKKISFLCPNGTIFRQLDLICDWWFKVDCAATPNHFAESTEMLSQAKKARLQSKHPVPQPINQSDERLTVSIQDKRLLLGSTSHVRQQQLLPKTPVRNMPAFNRRTDRSNSAESTGIENDGINNKRNVNRKDDADKIAYTTDEIQDTAQSASFASIAKKMLNTYYTQDQLFKDQTIANKLRRTEANDEGSHRDYLSALQLSKDARVENNSNSNRNAKNYMPYTTARKLNLNSKVTQFYTPTVPTFTTSTRTATVGIVTEDAMVTTKATTINGFSNDGVGGSVEPQSFENYEVLDFSDVTTTTTNSNPTTDVETTMQDTSTIPTTTVYNNAEYNKVTDKTDEVSRKQGKSLSIKFITNSRNELADEVNSELGAPASSMLLEDDEQLQRAQSESILASHNNRPIYERNKYSVISLHNFKENSVTAETFSTTSANNTQTATIQPSENDSQQQSRGGVPSSRTTMSYT